MGLLRTIFSKVGLCESHADLARKPELAAQLAQRSMAVTDPACWTPGTTPYAERLEKMLIRAESKALDSMIAQNITVCLDNRLKTMRADTPAQEVHILFYNGPAKVFSMNDFGKTEQECSTGEKISHQLSLKAMNELHYWGDVLITKPLLTRSVMLAHQAVIHYWTNAEKYEKLLQNNPGLAKPPLTTAGAAMHPAQDSAAPGLSGPS